MIQIQKTLAKKIFILEDDDNRIAWFKEHFAYAETLTITKQVGTAIELLGMTKYDLIFLDHDLEPDHYSAYAEGREPQMELTGLYVAKKLVETINAETFCIVHSMNPVGSQNIQQELKNYYACPFNILMSELTLL